MKYRLNQEGKGLKIQVEWVHEKVIGNAYLKKKHLFGIGRRYRWLGIL